MTAPPASPLHTVAADRCHGDGVCVAVCPKDVLEVHEGRARTVEAAAIHCLRCGQCVAVCPNEALALDGLPPDRLGAPGDFAIPPDRLLRFLLARRSVRVFKDQPVARELIDGVLAAAAAAPPGFPPHATEVVVLEGTDAVGELARACVEGYDKLLHIAANPVGRLVIRARRGADTWRALKSHVLAVVRWDNERHRARGVDRYLYGAPAAMLFHASRGVAGHAESALVVATYAMLAAHAAGLGATMLSIVPPVLNHIAHELRRGYGIPDDNEVVVALVLGHPRYRYRRTIRRELRSVRFVGAGT